MPKLPDHDLCDLRIKIPCMRRGFMTCRRCGNLIPAERGKRARYCSIRCRAAALQARYRASKKPRFTEQQQYVIESWLEDIRKRPRYRGGYVVDDNGNSHAWGAVDCDRYGQPNGTKDDVRKLRSDLKRAGLPLSFDQTDSLLSAAIFHDDGHGGWVEKIHGLL